MFTDGTVVLQKGNDKSMGDSGGDGVGIKQRFSNDKTTKWFTWYDIQSNICWWYNVTIWK